MKLLDDRPWPPELSAELQRQIAAIPTPILLEGVKELRQLSPQGFRIESKNHSFFRTRLHDLLLRDEASDATLSFFRHHSFYQDFVCVLSTTALLAGFHSMIAFTGGAKLILGMLLDLRPKVREKALSFIDSNLPYPPVPDDPDKARRDLMEIFGPFVQAFSEATVTPTVNVVHREETDKHLIASLQDELQRSKKARTAAENALKLQHKTLSKRIEELDTELSRLKTSLKQTQKAKDLAETLSSQLSASRKADEKDLRKLRSQVSSLEAFRDEAFRSRARIKQLEDSLETLTATCERLAEQVAELSESTLAAERTKLQEHIQAAPEPASITLPRTFRERLRDAGLTDAPKPSQRIRFLIDGHNTLPFFQSAQSDANESHAESRTKLTAFLAAHFPTHETCEMELYFDGGTRNDFTPSAGLRVHYSGGEGDHKADNAILDVLPFYVLGGDYCIVATEDADFRAKAIQAGSRVLHPTAFLTLLGPHWDAL